MAAKPTTTEARLKEIIDAYRLLLTVRQIENYRKTLLPEEIEALDAYIERLKEVKISVKEPTPGPKPPLKPTPKPPGPTGPKPLTQAEWQAKKKAEEEAAAKAKEAVKAKEAAAAKPLAEAAAKVPPQVISRPAPELIIKRTPYPKWWNDEGIAKISLSSPGSQFVITARGDYSLYIATIVLTVSGECDIVFTFGGAGESGSMDLGGTDEPRGMVIAGGNSPMPCGSGSFMITAISDDSVSIGGYISYYLWKKEAQ